MKNFTIDAENNITIYASAKEADAIPNSERFGNEAAAGEAGRQLACSPLVEIWNSLPGEAPVRKFKDRPTAVTRIWRAIQSLDQVAPAAAEEPAQVPETAPTPEQEASEMAQPEGVVPASPDPAPDTHVAPHSPDVAPEAAPPKTKATSAKTTPVAATTKEAGAPREGSKTSKVIAMLKREGGTTLEEIMAEMGWLKHTTRAMLSAGGSLTKNHGLVITSEKVGDKRVYSIKP
jgi:hypothetical protein